MKNFDTFDASSTDHNKTLDVILTITTINASLIRHKLHAIVLYLMQYIDQKS